MATPCMDLMWLHCCPFSSCGECLVQYPLVTSTSDLWARDEVLENQCFESNPVQNISYLEDDVDRIRGKMAPVEGKVVLDSGLYL